MYLPRSLISKLYTHLQSNRHALSQPALLLVALEPDALCACRILTRLLRHDYIPHKIQPVAGYADLDRAARDLVQPMMESRGGGGGVVICLGVGGMVDLGALLGLEPDGGGGSDDAVHYGGVEVWVLDSHRPWNLGNVFGGCPDGPAGASGSRGGRIERGYRPGKGGIVVFDDGDIDDELATEREAYMALSEMPDLDENGADHSGDEEDEQEEEEEEEAERGRASGEEDEAREGQVSARPGQKRKSWSDRDEEQSDGEDDRPRQRRRSNSGSTLASDSPSPARPPQRGLLSVRTRPAADLHEPPSAAQPPSARVLRSRLLRLRRENEAVLRKYYRIGASFSEPISSIVYSLASELGREDNDLLWLAIVGVTSMELYGRSSAGVAAPVRRTATSAADRDSHRPAGWLGLRGARIRQLLRDEVRRLNPPDMALSSASAAYSSSASASSLWGVIPTTARSPEDTSIRLSPEPKFLLIRHWSLYDSMLHSPYLFSRLKTWSEPGLRRLHKLLAKMGVSLVQCRQSYAHMDMALKRELRAKLLQYGSLYNLEDMVPGADTDGKDRAGAKDGWGFVRSWGWRATLSAQDVGVVVGALLEVGRHGHAAGDAASSYGGEARDLADVVDEEAEYRAQGQEWVGRFWDAYDALENVDALKAGLPTAQFLHRAIYRTGTSLIGKKQIRHLRAFRMCVVKDGPDVSLFNHPAALTKLAIWIGEALSEQERESAGRLSRGGRGTPLVVASLNERRGVYVVVGTGGGGGPDTALLDRDATRRRRAKREERARQREENRQNKAKIRDEKRAAKRAAAAGGGGGDGDGDGDGAGGEAGDGEEDGDELESESDDDDESEEEDDDEDDEVEVEREKGYGLNRFGSAFQEVVAETKARVRIDSFEHSVVEVKKEDLGAFLESLSMKAVVG